LKYWKLYPITEENLFYSIDLEKHS